MKRDGLSPSYPPRGCTTAGVWEALRLFVCRPPSCLCAPLSLPLCASQEAEKQRRGGRQGGRAQNKICPDLPFLRVAAFNSDPTLKDIIMYRHC